MTFQNALLKMRGLAKISVPSFLTKANARFSGINMNVPVANMFVLAKSAKPLLAQKTPLMVLKKGARFVPYQPNFETPSMFTAEKIMQFWECIPIICYTVVGFTCEVLWTLRLSLTRDDVCYAKKMGYERFNLNAKPPVKKFVNYNCNHETWPQGLIDAKDYFKDYEEYEKNPKAFETAEDKKDKSKKKDVKKEKK